MARSFIVGLLFVVTSLVAASAVAEPKQAFPERFQGKIVSVDVINGLEPYVVKNVELDTIGGRVFLVGQRHASSPGTPDAGGRIAIAWDRVVALKICDHRPAEASQPSGSDADNATPKAPVRFFLARAKSAVPELHRSMSLVAKMEVEVDSRTQFIADLEARMSATQRDIERLQADLARGEESYEYAGKTYTTEQVKADLTERERRLQDLQSTIRDFERARQVIQRDLERQKETIVLLKTVSDTKRRLEAIVQTETAQSERSHWEQWLSEAQQLEKALRKQKDSTGDDESQQNR